MDGWEGGKGKGLEKEFRCVICMYQYLIRKVNIDNVHTIIN